MENPKNDSKRFMAFDYVPFDFQRGLCQINCGGVMVTPGLCLEFWGGVTADLKLVSVDHECPILEALITGICWNAHGGSIPGNDKLKTW